MAGKGRFYLETTVVIELLERPKDDELSRSVWALLEDADARKCEVFTSSLTMVEVLFAESEKKKGKLDPKVTDAIEALWHPDSSPIQIIPCHEIICRRALTYFRTHWEKDGWRKSKGIDLVHLVTAQQVKVDKFYTTEQAMIRWAPVMGFAVCRPDYARPDPLPLFAEKGERKPRGR